MSRYSGLGATLSTAVRSRDNDRCRWCGRTNTVVDLHHITYRRGEVDDVADNLISLCRDHHDFVHGKPNAAGGLISKETAQLVLRQLIAEPGVTGIQIWRRLKRTWVNAGLCQHGNEPDACYRCRKTECFTGKAAS